MPLPDARGPGDADTGADAEADADVGVGVEAEAEADAGVGVVAGLLGRSPKGRFAIAVRAADGTPRVIANDPFFDDGTPMPTRFWLVDPVLAKRISQIESAGGVRAAEAAVEPDALAEAHASYAAERDALISVDHQGPRPTGGVGGTRGGVKCLHAHYAYFLAGGADPVGAWVDAQLDPPERRDADGSGGQPA